MTTSVDQFWQLAIASGLLSQGQVDQLAATYRAAHGDEPPASALELARWLVETRLLSAYQAAVLQAGHPGPFFYGDYLVYHKYSSTGAGRLSSERLYRAVHIPSQHVVVLLFLTGPGAQDGSVLARVAEQMELYRSLPADGRRSRAWGLVDLGAYKFLVTERIDGEWLDVWTHQEGPLGAGEACRIVREAALALAPLHVAGMAHGAVQLMSVIRASAGEIQLVAYPLAEPPLEIVRQGFGEFSPLRIARSLYAGEEGKWGGFILGALGVAPELLTGQARPDARSDVYALGWLLYFLLTGVPQLSEPLPAARLLRERLTRPLPELDWGGRKSLPPKVEKLLGYFLARDPGARYQSAAHVAEALAPYAALSPVKCGPPGIPATAAAYAKWLDTSSNVAVETAAPEIDFGLTAAAAAVLDLPPRAAAAPDLPARAKRNMLPRLAALGSLAAALAIGIYTVQHRGDEKHAVVAVPAAAQPAVPPAAEKRPATTRESPLGPPLWEHPGDGEPISLAWLPAGAQVIAALDAAALVGHPDGSKILDAMAPVAEKLNVNLGALTGVTLAQLERLLVGFYDLSPAPAEAAWVLRSKTPWDLAKLPLGAAPAVNVAGQVVHRDAARAAFVPAGDDGHTLVICPAGRLDELLADGGAPAELRREFQTLHAASDDACVLNVLFSPTFLTRGGKTLLPEELRPLDHLLEEFLGANATAALLSVQLDRDLFVELRVHGTAERPPLAVGQGLRERLLALPSRVEQHLATLQPSDYSREVLTQLPQMVQTLVEYTRAAIEDRHTVLRAYLPVEAAPNLIWGARLALRETPRGPGGPVTAQVSKPIAEILKQPYSMSFPRSPLDKALAQFGSDLGIEVIILGSDLQLEGITKNQPLQLNERDSTAAAILRKIMLQANADGKLVWVIKPRPDGGGEALFITTRAAAAARGDTLPPEFSASK